MKALIGFIVCMAPALVFGQTKYKAVHKDNGYKHYSNHKDQTHYKPQNNSYKPHPAETNTKVPVKKPDPIVKTTETAPVKEEPVSNTLTPLDAVYKTEFLDKESLKKLKAVIISADVDGAGGTFTLDYIKGMKEVATLLRNSGIYVQEFYCPNDNWEKIKAAAKDANILVYSGHGVYDGTMPPKWVGGFSLTDNFVSSEQIQNELKLAPNAVVVFNHVCFSAGSSAVDAKNIGTVEAHRRVAMYAHPYVDGGIGCYYANNFYGGAKSFFNGFLAGNSVNDIYINTTSPWSSVQEYREYEFNKRYKIGVSVYQDSYDLAIVGNPRLTVYDLLGNNQLVKK
ncbi:MAG: hypothetical protein ACJ75J_13830 [Cytophagaceae bacterium]